RSRTRSSTAISQCPTSRALASNSTTRPSTLRMSCTRGRGSAPATTPSRCSTSFPVGRSTVNGPRYNGVDMKIIVAAPFLEPHRARFEAALPVDAQVFWQSNGVSPDDLRDADVYVGSRFTAAMADTAEKLRLIHVAGAGTDKVDIDALSPDTLV